MSITFVSGDFEPKDTSTHAHITCTPERMLYIDQKVMVKSITNSAWKGY